MTGSMSGSRGTGAMKKSISPQQATILRKDRERLSGHKSAIIWFTGLSGSGKSTLAHSLENALFRRHARTYVLDGDTIRGGLNKDLGFSHEDRGENIRRIGEVSRLFMDAGVIVLTAFISPYRADRTFVRNLVHDGEFVEVYVKCPLQTCMQRDAKGLYGKAVRGEISHFTGIDDPYEEPEMPELTLDTESMSVRQCIDAIVALLEKRRILPRRRVVTRRHIRREG
jgi:adenylylsulfate kinase